MKNIFYISLFLSCFFSCKEDRNIKGLWNMTETTCTGFEDIQSFVFTADSIFIHYPTVDYSSPYRIHRDVVLVYENPSYDIVKLNDTELILYNFALDCLYYFER